MNNDKIYDILVIGGGINGAGIASDASGRGLSVFLCEQFDLANETSSRSSKMIHGGLRYLEYYEFRLVREALAEREVMLKIAPHLVQPLSLIIPHNKLQRPAWMVRVGLFMYDNLGKHFGKKPKLPKSKSVTLNNNSVFSIPLKHELKKGFCYSDCKVDDARLVIANAIAAHNRGAHIATRTKFIDAKKVQSLWVSTLEDQNTKKYYQVKSKTLINAAGPWVEDIVNTRLETKTKHKIELVKGSHIVTKKLYEGDHAYLLQNYDKRVIFVIPYANEFTMIGTTDIPYEDDPHKVSISEEERNYLCDVVNRYFKKSITTRDIVNEWSGVRPLQADDASNPSAVTRDYSLEIEDDNGMRPVMSIFGGKLTTYRKLSQQAMQKMQAYLPGMGADWTAEAILPGGDISDIDSLQKQLQSDYSFLPTSLLIRYAHSYGSLSNRVLNNAKSIIDMGEYFGADLYAKEVDYLQKHEWAQTVEDILWRRSKLGLQQHKINIIKLNEYLES